MSTEMGFNSIPWIRYKADNHSAGPLYLNLLNTYGQMVSKPWSAKLF